MLAGGGCAYRRRCGAIAEAAVEMWVVVPVEVLLFRGLVLSGAVGFRAKGEMGENE